MELFYRLPIMAYSAFIDTNIIYISTEHLHLRNSVYIAQNCLEIIRKEQIYIESVSFCKCRTMMLASSALCFAAIENIAKIADLLDENNPFNLRDECELDQSINIYIYIYIRDVELH